MILTAPVCSLANFQNQFCAASNAGKPHWAELRNVLILQQRKLVLRDRIGDFLNILAVVNKNSICERSDKAIETESQREWEWRTVRETGKIEILERDCEKERRRRERERWNQEWECRTEREKGLRGRARARREWAWRTWREKEEKKWDRQSF